MLDGRVPADALRKRIVLVGVSADSVKDFFLTPFNHRQSDLAGTPGVLVHAHAISQLLRAGLDGEWPLSFVPTWAGYLGMLAWSLVAVATALQVRVLTVFSMLAVLEALALMGGSYAAFLAGWWIPVVPLALVGVVSASLHHARGIGTQRLRRHRAYSDEKQVLTVLVTAERGDAVFESIYFAAGIDTPHAGMVMMGHAFRAAGLELPVAAQDVR